jgi:hypothetical protein
VLYEARKLWIACALGSLRQAQFRFKTWRSNKKTERATDRRMGQGEEDGDAQGGAEESTGEAEKWIEKKNKASGVVIRQRET